VAFLDADWRRGRCIDSTLSCGIEGLGGTPLPRFGGKVRMNKGLGLYRLW
jgi:hypothetical protein